MRHPEYVLSCRVAGILDAAGLLFTHVPLEEESAQRAAMERRMGVRKGCPDFLVFTEPRVAFEIKSKRGSTTPDQRRWLEQLASEGWRTAVCRSTKDVISLLRENYGQRIYGGEGD